ncbi:MAG: hypothetical protein AB7K09_16930 [Planctomycetota bacterium]
MSDLRTAFKLLYFLSAGMLSDSARVRMSRGRLRIAWPVSVLLLLSRGRTIFVDPSAREVRIRDRFLWVLFSTRRIPFSRIEYVDYDFASSGSSSKDAQQTEQYHARLVLKQPFEKLRVGSFSGEMGGHSQPHDRHTRASRRAVEMLSEVIGVPVGAPLRVVADSATGMIRRCQACGRPSAPKLERCIYCNGEVN